MEKLISDYIKNISDHKLFCYISCNYKRSTNSSNSYTVNTDGMFQNQHIYVSVF